MYEIERLKFRIKSIIEEKDDYNMYWRTNHIIYRFYEEIYPRLFISSYIEMDRINLHNRVEKKVIKLKYLVVSLQRMVKQIQKRTDIDIEKEFRNLEKKRTNINKKRSLILSNSNLFLTNPHIDDIQRIDYFKHNPKRYQTIFNLLKESLDTDPSFTPETFMKGDYRNDINYIVDRFKKEDIDAASKMKLTKGLNNLISYYGRGGLLCIPPTKNTLKIINKLNDDDPFSIVLTLAVFGPILKEMLCISNSNKVIDEEL